MIINEAINYLEYNFQFTLKRREWFGKSNLPLYLAKGYNFEEVLIEKKAVLFMACSRKETSVGELLSHLNKVKELACYNNEVILVLKSITNYQREKLIKEGLSFVIPGKQIYVPIFGAIFIEKLQDRFSIPDEGKIEIMKPTTQALFLELIASMDFSRSAQELGKKLNVSKMSITRAYKDLERMSIVTKSDEYYVSGYYFSAEIKEVWTLASKNLMDPVLKNVYVNESLITDELSSELIVSGESALSNYSMMSFPRQNVYGITSKKLKKYEETIELQALPESNTCKIEIWKHEMPSKESVLHPLAVFAVLRNEKDERVEDQLEQMIEAYFEKEIK